MGNLNLIISVATHHDLQKLSSDTIFRNDAESNDPVLIKLRPLIS